MNKKKQTQVLHLRIKTKIHRALRVKAAAMNLSANQLAENLLAKGLR